jgi:hypothetical protein
MVRKIEELAAAQKYDLAGLCRRFSDDRVARVDKLMPREAHKLIEGLKASPSKVVFCRGLDLC